MIAAALPSYAAAGPPAGYDDREILSGLNSPTSIAFSKDGRIYVSEKRGVVLRFHDRTDPTPTVVADLRTKVHSFYERGLMSLALDPKFPKRPFIYVSYSHDAEIGGIAPLFGKPADDRDRCLRGDPDPSFEAGCPGSSRVSRLTLGEGGVAIAEQVLVEDWCQQFPSHSAGDLAFDRKGALLVGGGDGAYFGGADIGQVGNAPNACADPPGEGGALRSQDLVTGGDPVTLDGTISRIDPGSGAARADNPLSREAGGAARVLSFGLRNPFRFTFRPGTNELWVGDVGWSGAEEINVARTDRARNFGWPCYEGRSAQAEYAAMQTGVCNTLYAEPKATKEPFLTYRHDDHVVEGEACDGLGGGAISGLAFDSGRRFPSPYDGSLLFTDYTRGCVWAVWPGRYGKPKRSTLRVFSTGTGTAVDLVVGPGGLFYVDLFAGTVRQIIYTGKTAEVRLRSRPEAIDLQFDQRTERSGTAITVIKGSKHRVSVPLRRRVGRRTYAFDRWSDGGQRTHRARIGATTGLVAVYGCVKGCGEKPPPATPAAPR